MKKYNLVMVTNQKVNQRSDFEQIADVIRQFHPDIRPTIIADRRRYRWLDWHTLLHPTMIFSPVHLKRYTPLRGAVFQGQKLSKSEECRRLESSGIPVPKWTLMNENYQPDLTEYSRYVVVKPDSGGRGADVKMKRKGRVRWTPPDTKFARKSEQWMVQQMVYTGPWPISYRVTTLFGEVLWSLKIEADRHRQPMNGAHDIAGRSITSSGKGCTFELNYDRQIITLAEQAHKAFPDIPLLGVDILKDHNNGKLYVIEVNAIGYVWHFSSPRGLKVQEYSGIKLDSQFNGIHKAAHILAKRTRENAC